MASGYPDPTNNDRADWAQEAIQQFRSEVYLDPEEKLLSPDEEGGYERLTESMRDLLSNMMHLATRHHIDWSLIILEAQGTYNEERYEEAQPPRATWLDSL